ncbi:ABC transporter ATP-binding protein [Nitrosomonas sp. PY1]|uniref:ABC transporter ATP-binding protein n=1 Tax=Nitrosomonas sp. PY1 TaxID=1803906 RepID=UPI001FC7D802|nr:ABC transporter ATP-binding protein [Nitrosomonas sp. PY1]
MLHALEIKAIYKNYDQLPVLQDVSLEIQSGEFFALLGPNGAGKTTLISIIAGLTLAASGSVHVMGYNVVTHYQNARLNLGVVPQELVFDPFFTVREILLIQSGYYGIKHNTRWVDEILARLDLADKADANMRSLSGGMKRRVLVAQALVHKPPVIILDEPTAGVDVELRQTLWEFIKQLNRDGHTIVLTTHYLEEAETLCNRVAMLKQGKIIALDTTQNLIKKIPHSHIVQLRLQPNALPQELRHLQVNCPDGTIELRLESYQQIEWVLASLRTAKIEVQEFRLRQPDLEDVFVSLMKSDRSALQ